MSIMFTCSAVADKSKRREPHVAHIAGRDKLDSLLVKQEAQVNTLIAQQIAANDYITMSLDGWTTERNQSTYAVNLSLDCPNGRQVLLYDVRDFSADRHTGEFLGGNAAFFA